MSIDIEARLAALEAAVEQCAKSIVEIQLRIEKELLKEFVAHKVQLDKITSGEK